MTSDTLPCRSASRASDSFITRGISVGDLLIAAACACADGPSSTATGTLSGALSRKAKPRARARMIGKPNTQNTASVSRMNSLVRMEVSSTMAGRTLGIAQLPSGQRDEQILQRRGVRGERDQLRALTLD